MTLWQVVGCQLPTKPDVGPRPFPLSWVHTVHIWARKHYCFLVFSEWNTVVVRIFLVRLAVSSCVLLPLARKYRPRLNRKCMTNHTQLHFRGSTATSHLSFSNSKSISLSFFACFFRWSFPSTRGSVSHGRDQIHNHGTQKTSLPCEIWGVSAPTNYLCFFLKDAIWWHWWHV